MSCVPLSPAMERLLETLTGSPDVDVDGLRSLPEWEKARSWGWVMASGELTGTGWGHVKKLSGGLLRE